MRNKRKVKGDMKKYIWIIFLLFIFLAGCRTVTYEGVIIKKGYEAGHWTWAYPNFWIYCDERWYVKVKYYKNQKEKSRCLNVSQVHYEMLKIGDKYTFEKKEREWIPINP